MPKRNIPVRNPVARSPLLHKGGAHIQSKTGQRVRSRLSTQSAIDDWYDDIEDKQTQDNDREPTLPVFLSAKITIGQSRPLTTQL